MGSQSVGHDLASEHTCGTYIRGKTPGKRQPNKRKDGSFREKEEEEEV